MTTKSDGKPKDRRIKYRVQPGETLMDIIEWWQIKSSDSWKAIKDENGISDPDAIVQAQEIIIPYSPVLQDRCVNMILEEEARRRIDSAIRDEFNRLCPNAPQWRDKPWEVKKEKALEVYLGMLQHFDWLEGIYSYMYGDSAYLTTVGIGINIQDKENFEKLKKEHKFYLCKAKTEKKLDHHVCPADQIDREATDKEVSEAYNYVKQKTANNKTRISAENEVRKAYNEGIKTAKAKPKQAFKVCPTKPEDKACNAFNEGLKIAKKNPKTPFKKQLGPPTATSYYDGDKNNVTLKIDDIISATKSRLESTYIPNILQIFPESECVEFPIAALVALIDMMYNLGINRFKKFKSLITSVKNKEWAATACGSHRRGISDNRNILVYDLFMLADRDERRAAKLLYEAWISSLMPPTHPI